MNRRRFALGLAAAAPAAALARAAGAQETPVPLGPGASAAIDDAVGGVMRRSGARGVSVAVARDGTTVFARGYGQRDLAKNLAVTPATIFPIGSITKQFTAACVMLLVKDGAVDLDAPVAHYLPGAPHADLYRVRDLLQQTTGLAAYTATPGFLALVTSSTVTPSALVNLVAGTELDAAPGTRFEYSNTNYVLAGMLIEHVSGKPYATVVHERIAVPLGLAHLTFGPPTNAADLARGYDPATGTAPVVPWSAQATYAAGGLYAAPDDLLRWDHAFFTGALLDLATVHAMTTPPTLPGGAATDYAFGWLRGTLDGHPTLWHNGSVLGGHAQNVWVPEQRIAIVVLGNQLDFDESPIVTAAFRALVPLVAAAGEDPAITARARAEYDRWRAGNVDFSRYVPAVRANFKAQLATLAAALNAYGAPTAFVFRGSQHAAGITGYTYSVVTPGGTMAYVYAVDAAGKIAGLSFRPIP